MHRFLSPYNDFGGNLLHIVMPSVVPAFSKIWNYPDGTNIRSGFEIYAAQYIAKALNFKFK